MKHKVATSALIILILFSVTSAYQLYDEKIPTNETITSTNVTEITSISDPTINNQQKIFFYPGDANNDGQLDIADSVFISNFLVGKVRCTGIKQLAQMDVNQDGKVTLADSKYLLKYLFSNGKPPKRNSIILTPYISK